MRFYLFLIACVSALTSSCSSQPQSSLSDKHLLSSGAIVYLEDDVVYYEECEAIISRGCSEEPLSISLGDYRVKLFRLIYNEFHVENILSKFGLTLDATLEDVTYDGNDGEELIAEAIALAQEISTNEDYSDDERASYEEARVILESLLSHRANFYRLEVDTLQGEPEKITSLERRYHFYKSIFLEYERSHSTSIGQWQFQASEFRTSYKQAVSFCEDLVGDWQVLDLEKLTDAGAFDAFYSRLELWKTSISIEDPSLAIDRVGIVHTLTEAGREVGMSDSVYGPSTWLSGGNALIIAESCRFEACRDSGLIGAVFHYAPKDNEGQLTKDKNAVCVSQRSHSR